MNTYREPKPTETDPVARGNGAGRPAARKKGRVGRSVHQLLNGEFLTREGLINHLPFIGFLTLLFLLHISLMYYFEHTQLEMARRKRELNELKSEYNTTMSELETRKQQSSVAREIESLGLKELRTPPQIIDVAPGFLEEVPNE